MCTPWSPPHATYCVHPFPLQDVAGKGSITNSLRVDNPENQEYQMPRFLNQLFMHTPLCVHIQEPFPFYTAAAFPGEVVKLKLYRTQLFSKMKNSVSKSEKLNFLQISFRVIISEASVCVNNILSLSTSYCVTLI